MALLYKKKAQCQALQCFVNKLFILHFCQQYLTKNKDMKKKNKHQNQIKKET